MVHRQSQPLGPFRQARNGKGREVAIAFTGKSDHMKFEQSRKNDPVVARTLFVIPTYADHEIVYFSFYQNNKQCSYL